MGFGKPLTLNDSDANKAAQAEYDRYCKRVGADPANDGWLGLLDCRDNSAMAAWLLTHLWDYTAPLESLSEAPI